MAGSRQYAVFGKRKEPHTVIIARGNEVRHFTVRPWMAAVMGSAIAAAAIGYLAATSYLVLRDDLMGAAVARQARMQQAYEDRISALRAQVDRITSRQMLDQKLMEDKVAELLDRQSQLTRRHGRLDDVLERAKGLDDTTVAPVPAPRPETRAEIDATAMPATANAFAPALASPPSKREVFGALLGSPKPMPGESGADRADRMFVAINKSLRTIESEQIDKLRRLTESAQQRAETIASALEAAGLKIDADYGESGTGGPFIPASPTLAFDSQVAELDEALNTLDGVRSQARKLPIASPAPGKPVTSSFGVRRDPILGLPAMHAGMDFRSQIGDPIRATAPGTVVRSGWAGGYGRLVEVDHGNGLTTRYAHMSKILVKEGDLVQAGDVVGQVGSSGRSTGPHLHYEVRRNGEATDPLRYLKAGRKIANLL